MQKLILGRTAARAATLALTGLFGLSLAACNGGGSTSVPGFNTKNGYFRFVNGSADAGAVDVYVDGQKVNSSGPLAYGGITAYNKFSVGSHTVTINAAGTQTAITLPAQAASQAVNGDQYVSLVLAGETHPSSGSAGLNLLAFSDQAFSTPNGGMAVNFHDAAPAVSSQGNVPFGYYLINTPATKQSMGTAAVGAETKPAGVPNTALNANTQVGFYAVDPTTISIQPSQIDPASCAANTLPCNTGNLSLYLIDGPAASTSPVAAPYPQGITASQHAGFVGIFDANGT